MTNRDAILAMINKAYQIEVDGYTFYSMTAERADKEAVKDLFGKLAADELQHQAFLKNVARHYDEQGAAAFALNIRPDRRTGSEKIFTGRFREQAVGAQFELAVLSIGMTLETNAYTYFQNAAKTAGETEVRDFYQFLADWEKQHFDALSGLFNTVRADHMADSGFSPF